MKSDLKNWPKMSAGQILKSVKDAYDIIAKDWDAVRDRSWQEFELLDDMIKDGDKVLDLGCGNGRLYKDLKSKKNIEYAGIDNSQALIKIAKQKYPAEDFRVGEALALPFANKSFDFVASFAVAHHIPGVKNRELFLAEVARVLKPKAQAFITVWNLHQPKYEQYLQDSFVPFGPEKVMRYVYGFTPDEFTKLAEDKFKVEEVLFTKKREQVSNWKEAFNLCFSLRLK